MTKCYFCAFIKDVEVKFTIIVQRKEIAYMQVCYSEILISDGNCHDINSN